MLYTFFMILVTCAALAILFSLSSREVLSLHKSEAGEAGAEQYG